MKDTIRMLCGIMLIICVISGFAIIVYTMGNVSNAVMTVNPERAVLCTIAAAIAGIIILCRRNMRKRNSSVRVQ